MYLDLALSSAAALSLSQLSPDGLDSRSKASSSDDVRKGKVVWKDRVFGELIDIELWHGRRQIGNGVLRVPAFNKDFMCMPHATSVL